MDSHEKKVDQKRRVMMKQAFVAGVATIAVSAILRPTQARAAKAAKGPMMYQDKPHGAQFCANCNQFEPGPSATAMGTCKVVDGSIAPKGWCVAYTPNA